METYSFAKQLATIAPRERTTVIGGEGVKIAMQSWGNESGETIVFLHAYGTNHLMWAPQIASELADTYNLVTFDHRGHGESEKPIDAAAYGSGKLIADDVAVVIEATGASKVHIVAWSMSGALFGDYLQHHGGDRIASVTLIAAANALGPTLFGLGQIGSVFADPKANLIHSPHYNEQLVGWSHVNRNLTTKPMDAASWAAVTASSFAFPHVGRASILMRDADYLEQYQALAAPLQLIHAKDDHIVTMSASERIKAQRADARLTVLNDGGHAPHWEHSDRVTALIASHVSGRAYNLAAA
jgi:non-heme chloroperoxidase